MDTASIRSVILFFCLLFLFLLVVNFFDISYPLRIINVNQSSELSVVGEGKIDVIPDKAFVNLGITVNNVSSVDEAQKQINETNNKLIQAMKGVGIPAGDIKTSNYSITPNYSNTPSDTEKINGYSGNANIAVTVKNTALISKVLEAATKAGANEIQGISYEVEDPSRYREQARSKAIENAKEQAKKLANSLGIRLGKITNIIESSPDQPYPIVRPLGLRQGLKADGGPQIEPGTQTITSTVTLFFEKK